MPRRPIALLVLAIASFVLGACTSVTAPTQNDSCRSGYILSDGRCAN
jgi:outer membrane biogenesis lipoprotein LolB